MKILENILYLEFMELVECGISENTLKDAKRMGYNCWRFIDDPIDKRKVLIDYECLKDGYKKAVLERFGNPYDRVARMPILKMVELDFKANEFYKKYTYRLGEKEVWLDISVVNKYTRSASWLKMVNKAYDAKKEIKKALGLSVAEFFLHVDELINVEKKRGKLEGYAGLDVLPGDFPASYQRLMAKASAYAAGGYEYLIDPLYGNKHAAKIGKQCANVPKNNVEMPSLEEGFGTEIVPLEGENETKSVVLVPKTGSKGGTFDPELYDKQMAVIRTVSAKANNFDAGQVAEMVNIVFEANGWKTLSRARIHDIISENKHLLTPGRQGKRKYMSNVAMQVKRRPVDMPLKYWTLDGWTVELLYQERGKKKIDYKRLVVVVVLDAFTKYPVGYAIGERENAELIREANRNALLHIHELFGKYYRPWQVQSDNYSISQLTPFYQAMTHLHTPAAVGNAKAKIIEPYFMHLNKDYCQKMPNWSGFNITANRENQVNTEYLDKIKHSMPDKKGVTKQVQAIMARERDAHIDNYREAFGRLQLTSDAPQVMNEMDWLEVFGKELGDRTCRITGQGLEKVVGGVKYLYESFDPAFRANLHIDWTIMGDECDMSRVLAVSPDRKMKFVLEHKHVVAMDVRSSTPEDHAYRARITQFNNDRVDEITELYGSDANITRRVIEDTPFDLNNQDELDLKLMLTIGGQQKERIQDAKGLRQAEKKEQKRIAAVAAQHVDVFELKRQLREEELVGDFSRYAD